MVLGFMQHFDKKKTEPTNFREKILAGAGMIRWKFNDQWYITDLNRLNAESKYNGEESNLKPDHKPKLHTLRADPHNRWKAGRKIEMGYRGVGYKIIDHFNKGIPELEKCVSVQRIKIDCIVPPPSKKNPYTNPEMYWPRIEIDGKRMYVKEFVEQLARNDGFESITQFCGWFNKDFTGKIIHWTDLRY